MRANKKKSGMVCFKKITLKLDNPNALADQAEEYFSLLDKAGHTPAEELRLKMYKSNTDV